MQSLDSALRILNAGGLVGIPTETVYGLGADASNPQAVRRIFAAKGRPADHPLIVHLGTVSQLHTWAKEVPAPAWVLAQAFWPGPLTLIFKRAEGVLDEVTGGADTVALRIPDHPLTLQLLQQFGRGIAAPSANKYGAVSPTTAQHVRDDLGNAVDLVLDGGPCRLGIESTIVDVSRGMPVILRPGGISQQQLEDVLGFAVQVESKSAVKTSGQDMSHYAPNARVYVVTEETDKALSEELLAQGLKIRHVLLADANELARQLYGLLREADEQGMDAILIQEPRPEGVGVAVLDRLQRAAAPRKNK